MEARLERTCRCCCAGSAPAPSQAGPALLAGTAASLRPAASACAHSRRQQQSASLGATAAGRLGTRPAHSGPEGRLRTDHNTRQVSRQQQQQQRLLHRCTADATACTAVTCSDLHVRQTHTTGCPQLSQDMFARTLCSCAHFVSTCAALTAWGVGPAAAQLPRPPGARSACVRQQAGRGWCQINNSSSSGGNNKAET